ncbi:hypothetical protein MAR_014590 [Mya arenaria]|uniref:Uncharacterized protein n=1 Tax=Mya arenaria TaxID=6604 RepID=A0ABY7GCE4_MYAAR|nr:uncharacterized protein LOC128220529 [Mya arenaria]XP_052784922.1 uncharacterized protein LOC128220529 [Mya arenaria]WAR28886.1 hypothetical protein MAR_014590 [Mya arenaria]
MWGLTWTRVQMTYRYLWKNRWEVALLVVTVIFLYIWIDGFGANRYPYDDAYFKPCSYPCYGQSCIGCRDVQRLVTVKDVNIIDHLKLRKALRSSLSKAGNVSDSAQICKRPNFDLNHDSVKYAFFKMEKLNCSKEELFYLENDVFKFKKFKIEESSLKKCVYYGIERANDNFASYSEPLTKKIAPYDTILDYDFVRIKCYLVKQEEKEIKEIENVVEDQEIRNDANNDLNVDKRTNSSHLEYIHVDDAAGNNFKLEDEGVDDNDVIEESNYSYDVPPFYHYEGFGEFEEADFDHLFARVVPKAEVFSRIKKLSPKTDFQTRPNVLMFGLDSMSHLSWQRKLPKTYRYLKDVLGSVVLDGYNIVGDATTAALIPMLTGKSEDELPEVRKNTFDSLFVDAYPLAWKDFRERGYVTLFAEDEPTIGVFNLRLNGFQDQPTDHYMRCFWQALWDTQMRKDSPRYCTGNVPNHIYLLNYTKDYFRKYENVSKFAFVFGSELTHWDNNPGEYMDSDIVDMLEFFRRKGYLDNTIVLAFADHGARYSRVRKTVQGKMEERLPFMSIAVPKWFREKYKTLYNNLLRNADKLATPFDIHETLMHILQLESYKSSKTSLKNIPRAISLFDKIPATRTCEAAHIQMHWCTCLKQLDLDVSDKHVQKSVNALVRFLNNQTKHVRTICEPLQFQALHHAFLLIPNEKVLMFQKSLDEDNRVANFSSQVNIDHAHFQVTIETSPNRGLFETTVQVNMTAGTYTVIESEISRLDRYGSQPACVQEKYPDLRKYCYCKNYKNATVDRA